MITEPKQDDIDHAFRNTNFGPLGETPEGRRYLVAECVMKRACGFSSGHTIEVICKQLKLLTKSGTPKINAKHWAYCYIIDKLGQREAKTSKQAAGEAVAPDLSDDGIGRIADDVYRAMRDNGYTGAQGGVWWNKSMYAAGWNAGYRATPPRHPADEGMARDAELPELPPAREAWLPTHTMEYYTEDDMRAYALAALAGSP